MSPSPVRPRHSGFTLLELVLAMALLAIIVGMVFGTARTSLALGNSIVESQNEEMLHQAFFELLGQRFSALPGNTRFDLKVDDSGSHYISDITLQNVPMGFTWGGQERIAKAVQISTVKRRSGYLDIAESTTIGEELLTRTLQAGEYVIEVYEWSHVDPTYSASQRRGVTCFNVSVTG